jgi:hypothetical protein
MGSSASAPITLGLRLRLSVTPLDNLAGRDPVRQLRRQHAHPPPYSPGKVLDAPGFEAGQDLVRPIRHLARQAREPGDVDAVG